MISIQEATRLIENKLGQMGFELYDLKYSRGRGNSLLRIFIDRPEGVTIDDCEATSVEISQLLDIEDFSNTPYRLEVSSPGADRPLKKTKDFIREKGRRIRLQTKDSKGKQITLRGKIIECDMRKLTIELDNNKETEIELENIIRAKIEMSFK